MSLISRVAIPKKAETDIKCYKIFKENDSNTYSFSTYPRNYSVSVSVILNLGNSKFLEPAEKSCIPVKIVDSEHKEIDGLFEITCGAIHSCNSAAQLTRNKNKIKDEAIKKKLVLFECEIPKGSWYFEDYTGQSYASEKLRIIKKLF